MAQWNLQILCLKSKITLHPKLRSIFSPLKDSSIILETAQLFNMEVPEKLSVDEKLYPHLSLIIWATIDFETRNIKFYNEFNKKKIRELSKSVSILHMYILPKHIEKICYIPVTCHNFKLTSQIRGSW